MQRIRIADSFNGVASEHRWSIIIDAISGYANQVHVGVSNKDPIVFAFPGPVIDGAKVVGAPTVVGTAVQFPDFSTILAKNTARPVYLLNDVSAAAWWFEGVAHVDRFLVVTISSGIGSKIVDRSTARKVIDVPPYTGEIGHIVVDPSADAPVCDCGGRGHLSAFASGRGAERLARRLARSQADEFEKSMCASLGATKDELSNEKHLVPAIAANDPWALSVLRLAIAPLAEVLRTIIVGAGLEKVFVIGGFASQIPELYANELTSAILRNNSSGLLALPAEGLIDVDDAAGNVCLLGAGLFARSRVAFPS